MNLRNLKTVKERREALEKVLNIDLKNIGSFTLDESVASTRNCENMVGVAQVPLGVAGPLKIKNQISKIKYQKSKRKNGECDYYIPLATTEGALVASVNRGCKAITESGGAWVASEHVGATRGPVFQTSGIVESQKLKQWLDEHTQDLDKVAAQTSSHLLLKKLGTRVVGKYVYVRFYFDTQDAMGMNMATIASDALVTYIEQKTGVTCIALAGNFDIDKKAAWLNFIENRGTKAWAEVTIPENVLHNALKTTAQKMYEVWLAKCMIGSAMSGSMGFNAQYANVIAAIFIATGQDPAHVVEGSLGITTAEIVDGKDLYINVVLPDLMVGTVGGGTGLATQQEALELLGVAGGAHGKNSQKFAEIIAGAVLAGEISLLASLAEGTLAKAHAQLARGEVSSKFKTQNAKPQRKTQKF